MLFILTLGVKKISVYIAYNVALYEVETSGVLYLNRGIRIVSDSINKLGKLYYKRESYRVILK